MCGLNLIVTGLMLGVRSRTRYYLSEPSAAVDDSTRVSHSILAFFSGFAVLALEVVLQHQLAQVTINSLFSNATVLAMVLISLALSALVVPLLASRIRSPQRVIQIQTT